MYGWDKTVGAENEWHPNHDTRNTVRYYGKNKVWYQTTHSGIDN